LAVFLPFRKSAGFRAALSNISPRGATEEVKTRVGLFAASNRRPARRQATGLSKSCSPTSYKRTSGSGRKINVHYASPAAAVRVCHRWNCGKHSRWSGGAVTSRQTLLPPHSSCQLLRRTLRLEQDQAGAPAGTPTLGLHRCSSDPFCSGCSERNRLRFGARRGRSSERQSDHGRTLPSEVGVEDSTVALQLPSEAVPVPVSDCRSLHVRDIDQPEPHSLLPCRGRIQTEPPPSRGSSSVDNLGMDDERPPICPACGVTMVPAAISARESCPDDWVCIECEETDEPDV